MSHLSLTTSLMLARTLLVPGAAEQILHELDDAGRPRKDPS